MKEYLDLLNSLETVRTLGEELTESWSFLKISGSYNKLLLDKLRSVSSSLSKLNISEGLRFQFDSESVTMLEFLDYESSENSFIKWTLNFNKEVLLAEKVDKFYVNLFLLETNCKDWLEGLNPLEEDNKLNIYTPLKIFINDLDEGFGGEYLYFLPNKDAALKTNYQNLVRLPTNDKIKEHVHFITNEKVNFNPNTYVLRQHCEKSVVFNSILKHSSIVFATCAVNEYYSLDKIALDGIKRMVLKLTSEPESYSSQFNQELRELVRWLYEDRATTRKKLFNDRLTLEIDSNATLTESLRIHNVKSLEQAKGRYNFVILERKDAYVKELKDLLKDIRTQSDLYSLKIRTLLNNFLRDALAAIILIGFTVFTKFSENIGLEKHDLLQKVFFGLGIYYTMSLILQSVTDWVDINISQNEIKYWKRVSKELIPDKEFTTYFNDSLKTRIRSSYILYPVIGILYAVIILSCFLYPYLFEKLILK